MPAPISRARADGPGRRAAGCALALLAAVWAAPGAAAPWPAQEGPDRDWYWCQLAERPYGRTVYVSDVFTPQAGSSEVEVETAFEAHVQRRYVGEPVAGGLCLGPKASREDTRRDRQDAIASLRRGGVTVVRTDWRFRGSRER
jgi:hypothetical protein